MPKKKNFAVSSKLKLGNVKWKAFYAFEAFGVRVGIRSNDLPMHEQIIAGLPFLLPIDIKEIPFDESVHIFSIYWSNRSRQSNLAYCGEREVVRQDFKSRKIDLIESHIRLTIAEFAEDYVFLHAGAVEYRGKAIIIPAKSFAGKTTLTAEFARRGFEYYSDEYAVLDQNGLVHPFTKRLSMRGIIDDYTQVDIEVEELGGRKGTKPLEVGLILVQKFIKRAKFAPKLLGAGEGIIESIANSVSIRQNPQFVLKVLSFVTNRAKIVKTNRGEAKQFVDKLLSYLDEIGY
jgi:hypothetical protein